MLNTVTFHSNALYQIFAFVSCLHYTAIDWDCKIVKSNSEKQENRFAEQFSREFIDKKAKSGKIFLWRLEEVCSF